MRRFKDVQGKISTNLKVKQRHAYLSQEALGAEQFGTAQPTPSEPITKVDPSAQEL